MDAGLAAIIGAAIGAGASTLVAVLDRIFGAFARRRERIGADRAEIRDALLELDKSLGSLIGMSKTDADRVTVMQANHLALSRFDLLLSRRDAPMAAVAVATSTLVGRDDGTAIKALSAFSLLSSGWFRREYSANRVATMWSQATGVPLVLNEAPTEGGGPASPETPAGEN